jgi:DNA invertase Pin-like site-specific DNA recombinase
VRYARQPCGGFAFARKAYGVTTVFQEKQSSVKKRPVLDKVMQTLKPGDVLVVYKLDRLARSMSHFVKLCESLKQKQAGFKSLTESIETETAQGRMFMNLLAIFAEFERELIRERCMAGQKAARARGRKWGRVANRKQQNGGKMGLQDRDYYQEHIRKLIWPEDKTSSKVKKFVVKKRLKSGIQC